MGQNISAADPQPILDGLQSSKLDLKLENSSTPQCPHILPQLGAFRVLWPQNVPYPGPRIYRAHSRANPGATRHLRVVF